MAAPATELPSELAAGRAMDDGELAALLAAHEDRSIGYYNSEIAGEQAKAIDYYYGRPFGDEREGRSKVVERTVAITVDNALAALLRPFVSAEDVVSFEPRGPEDMDTAEQATEFINYVFQVDNPGFLILHNWFKDALLTKIGIVKFWWEDQSKHETQHHQVDALGLDQMREHEGYQGEEDHGDGTWTVATSQPSPDGRARVETVPPEEFLISPFSRSIEEAPYVAHRPSNITRSDVIKMGFDPEIVETLPAFAQAKNDETRSRARYLDEQWSSGNRIDPGGKDPSLDQIGLMDEYIRVDYDGDGIAELRRIIRVNDMILLNEVVDEAPFAILCPVPMPHKVYGLSLADQTLDLQRIQSVLWRQTLDNIYLSNNPRPVVPDTAVNDNTYEDLMSDEIGAIIRTKTEGLDVFTIPFVAKDTFPLLQYAEQQGESRTGIRRGGQGLDRNALSTSNEMTALQAAQIEAKENERVEMIARIFAETGVTRLFRGLLNLVTKYQPKARVIRLRNKWVPVDPRGWPEMDVRISVGLGMGNKMDQLAQADAILTTMQEVGVTPFSYLIKQDNVVAALKRKFQAAGIKNVDDYITVPEEGQEPPAPPPSPDQMKVQADMMASQSKLQLDGQMAAANLQHTQAESAAKLQLQQASDEAKMQLEREKAAAQTDLALRQQNTQAALNERQMQLDHEHRTRQQELDHEHRMKVEDTKAKISKLRPGGQLDK